MSTTPPAANNPATASDLTLERYKYILQQIHTVNENLYRFLAVYQTLATALVGAALALFVGYRSWHVAPAVARVGVIGLLTLATVVAGFTVTLIVVGIVTWLDYRTEECELTDKAVYPGFREPPKRRNFFRWYETYVLAFIVVSIAVMWLLNGLIVLPAIT